MNSCTGPCGQNSANCKTPDACQVSEALPPLYLWLRREMRAAMQIPRWYSSFRNNGFGRRRSAFLAWRTTRPVRRSK